MAYLNKTMDLVRAKRLQLIGHSRSPVKGVKRLIFLRRGAPFLNSYVLLCPPLSSLSSVLCLSHFFVCEILSSVGFFLT